MKRLLWLLLSVLLLAGCSTLQVDGVKYDSFMATTDTLTITKPDGTKINLKGKTTFDPSVLTGLLTK